MGRLLDKGPASVITGSSAKRDGYQREKSELLWRSYPVKYARESGDRVPPSFAEGEGGHWGAGLVPRGTADGAPSP